VVQADRERPVRRQCVSVEADLAVDGLDQLDDQAAAGAHRELRFPRDDLVAGRERRARARQVQAVVETEARG